MQGHALQMIHTTTPAPVLPPAAGQMWWWGEAYHLSYSLWVTQAWSIVKDGHDFLEDLVFVQLGKNQE